MLDFLKKNQNSNMGHSHNFVHHGQEGTAATAIPSETRTFNKVINFCLYALVLLTPFLFSSLTSEVREFNKQALLFFGVAVMMGAWIVKILVTRRVGWVKTSLDYVLLGYLGIYLVSSLWSIDRVSSFLGYYGRFTGSFVSVACFVILYFLVVNNVRDSRTVRKITNYMVAGMGLVLVYGLLQLLGLYVLPMAFTHDRGFNPIGSLVGLGVFASISLVYFQYLMFYTQPSKVKSWTLVGLSVVAFAVLFLVNAFVAWLILSLGLVAFLAIATTFSQDEHKPAFMWKQMLLLVLAVLFIAFQFLPAALNPRNLVRVDLPVEIQFTNSTTWTLVKNALSAGPKETILGSGPGTTGIVFGEIKPQALNQTIVWSLNFDRAPQETANLAIETGILGLTAFELASLLFLAYAVYFLIRKQAHPAWHQALGFFLIWLSLYLSHFFYFFNTTFYLLFWLSLALFVAVTHWHTDSPEEKHMSMASSPRSALSWMFASLLLLAVLLIAGFFQIAVLFAEMSYTAGLKEFNNSQPDLARAESKFGSALTMNPYRDVYYLAYGQNLILQASQEAAKQQPDTAKIQTWMSDLIAAGQSAVNISPQKPSNWQALAGFYANIKPLVSGADQFIIQSLQKAVERDSKNPSLHYQLGQAYLAASTPTKEGEKPNAEMLKNAETELKKAIELKSDLAEFYIQLARVYERGEKAEEAKKTVDEAVALFPNNAEVVFEQGRLTYNAKDYAEAEKIFSAIVAAVPNHADAMYSLGLVYQNLGNTEKAIAQYEQVIELIGPGEAADNLQKLIDQLKAQPTPPPAQ